MKLFRICRATLRDLPIVVRLIDDAAAWLRTKSTDQWRHPWPTLNDRNARLYEGLIRGKTWIVRDGDVVAATVTVEEAANPKVWTELEADEPAVYVNRLVVHRRYAGLQLGAALLNWAGNQAVQDYGARWIRIDVWTTNNALHAYYEGQGFIRLQNCSDQTYPSGARFQRATTVTGDYGGVELITVHDAQSLTRSAATMQPVLLDEFARPGAAVYELSPSGREQMGSLT
jgi:GNAT superfamily N-acetyltransferase